VTRRAELATKSGIRPFLEAGQPGALDSLLPGTGPWEIELGFGKGRFLLARAEAQPGSRFLGVEVAGEYFRLVARRLERRGLANLALVRAEALSLLATTIPPGSASALHVYFPDPWPKSRHQRRRLFSPSSVDLVLGALAPGGTLWFATDYLDYGEEVRRILASFPGVEVRTVEGGWPEGPRTNYEAKYEREARAILRLEVRARALEGPHPDGRRALVAGVGGEPGTGPGAGE